jgi:hypothetical protein
VGSQDKPGNGGILITDKAYGDFEIALEMRNDFGPDSGLFLRSTEKGEAYQAMIDYHAGGNLMGIYGEGIGGTGRLQLLLPPDSGRRDAGPRTPSSSDRARGLAVVFQAWRVERASGAHRRQPAPRHHVDQRYEVDGVDRYREAVGGHGRHRPPGPRRRRLHEAVRPLSERAGQGTGSAGRPATCGGRST